MQVMKRLRGQLTGLLGWMVLVIAIIIVLHIVRFVATDSQGIRVVPTVDGSAWPVGGKLFFGSVGLAATTTGIALLLAFPVGLHLGRTGRIWIAGFALVPLVIPPHLGAYVWRFILEDGSRAIFGAALWQSSWGVFFGASWTLAAIYWPLIALPIAITLHLRGNRLRQELATLAPPRAVFWKAVVPGLLPGLIAGGGVVFLLALFNYGVPLMWDLPAQSVAVFARLAGYFERKQVLILSLPLVAVAVACCGAGVVCMGRRSEGHNLGLARIAEAPQGGRRFQWPAILTGLVLALTVAVPVADLAATPNLFAGVDSDFLAGGSKFACGSFLAAVGATGALILGMICARLTRHARRAWVLTIEVLGLLALFLPAALLCLALNGAFFGRPVLGALYNSLGIFFLAYGIRFFYIPWKLTRFAQRIEGREHEDLKRLLGLGIVSRATLAIRGILLPVALIAWLLVFALALGELEMASFLEVPGYQPISVYFNQLMHYSRTVTVAQWVLIVVATEIVLAWVLLSIGLWQWRRLRATV